MKGGVKVAYQEGFEDSLELCLEEVKRAKSRRDAVQQIEYLLGLVKEHKFDQIKQRLGALR